MSKYNIGDIVALNSHPYIDNLTSIIISGEPQLVSPLMVIVEILNDTIDQYDEKTGEEISKKGNSQCKCIWYSSKSQQFEETWLSSKLLKHIKHNPENNLTYSKENTKQLNGRLVLLKTSRIEGEKLKSSISIESTLLNSNKDKNITNPLLSFLSPVMQIIQIIEVKGESKETSYDKRTGGQRRFTSSLLIKCKWYNPTDKFSEKILPIECLELIPEIDPELLQSIQDHIENFGYYTYEQSIIQPQKIYSLNGIYILKAYDYVQNKIINIELTDNISLKIIGQLTINEGPTFDFKSGDELEEKYFDKQKTAIIESARTTSSYIRIKYKKRNGEMIIRTLKEYSLIAVKEGKDDVVYLKAYDITRQDIRNFRIDKIETLQELNLSF